MQLLLGFVVYLGLNVKMFENYFKLFSTYGQVDIIKNVNY